MYECRLSKPDRFRDEAHPQQAGRRLSAWPSAPEAEQCRQRQAAKTAAMRQELGPVLDSTKHGGNPLPSL